MRRGVLAATAAVVAAVLIGAIALLVEPGRPVPTAPGTAAAAAAAPPARLTWTRCADPGLRAARAACAVLRAPLDWSHPRDGRTVALAVARVRHTTSRSSGVVVANPGGPGSSGLALAELGARVPHGVGARYDWVGFDPRGVGASRPRLTCDADAADGPRPRYVPADPAGTDAWWSRSAAYAKACAADGPLLAHATTRDSAEDVDYLRRALGVSRIVFYGFSYGTYLGQVYATLHPDRVSRMVLDSVVDPARVWYGANLDQDPRFDANLDAWFDWLAARDGTYRLGATRSAVQASYRRVADGLAAHPADGRFGSAELDDALLYAAYSEDLWPDLGRALAAAARGDAAAAEAFWTLVDRPDDDNARAAYLAVQCTDAPWPRDRATWERDARRTAATAPLGTWLNTWFNAPCRTWPAAASTPVRVDGGRVPPILLIDQTLDAPTPYPGSLAVRRLFPRARLLAQPGGRSHAASLSGDACVDDRIAAYLADGTLPARRSGPGPDATCAPDPAP